MDNAEAFYYHIEKCTGSKLDVTISKNPKQPKQKTKAQREL